MCDTAYQTRITATRAPCYQTAVFIRIRIAMSYEYDGNDLQAIIPSLIADPHSVRCQGKIHDD